jgi:hypothetical protein
MVISAQELGPARKAEVMHGACKTGAWRGISSILAMQRNAMQRNPDE